MTKQQKQVYETPTIETLELRFEGMICGSFNSDGTEIFNDGGDENF